MQSHMNTPEPQLWRDLRRWLAGRVEYVARLIYRSGEHRETIEIRDEFGVCRCTLSIASDEYAHGIDSVCDELPSDWELWWFADGERWQ